MDRDLIKKLEQTLDLAVSDLPKVTSKKMFGCHALFANENVFALVWKHGRIGVKLLIEEDFQKLMKEKGSEPWKAGPMQMKHWILVPERYSNTKLLGPWVRLAHCQALKSPKAKNKNSKRTKK